MRLHLEYCSLIWSPYHTKDKDLIKRVQRLMTRMIPCYKDLNYEEHLQRLGLWYLKECRNGADLIELYKLSGNSSSKSFKDMFELNAGDRTRGHSLVLTKQRCRFDVRNTSLRKKLLTVGTNWTRIRCCDQH